MCAVNQATYPAFITLTSLPATPWPVIMKGFANLVRRLKRQYPDLAYAAAKEEGHQTGMRHLHIIMLGVPWIDQAELSRVWAQYTKAPVVHIARINSTEVFGYVAKYAAKTSAYYRKCVTYSASWPQFDPWPTETFSEPMFSGPTEAQTYIRSGDGSVIEYIAPGCHCFDRMLTQLE